MRRRLSPALWLPTRPDGWPVSASSDRSRCKCCERSKSLTGIRLLRPADLPRILKIERASFGIDAWPADLFRDYARDCPGLFFVATSTRGLAGYCIICVNQVKAEIVSIAVSPRNRGRGIATLLLKRSIRKARRAGAKDVWLMVRRDNQGAIALYRRFGFVRVASVNGYYEDGVTAWRMRLPLA